MVAVADVSAEQQVAPVNPDANPAAESAPDAAAGVTVPAEASQANTAEEAAPAAKPAAKKKQPILKRFFFGSYKSPEERQQEEEEARRKKAEKGQKDAGTNEPERTDDAGLRKFFHNNICQSISAQPLPKKPPPTPEEREAERKQKEEKEKERKPLWTRIKESFRGGERTTNKKGAGAANTAGEPDNPVQGPDPMPEK